MKDIADLKRWRHEESERQWRRNMQTYVLPIIGDIPLDEIGIKEVLSIVEPIWTTKTETASRVLGQLATFLNWANVHGYRSGDNPAQWNGKISMILPLLIRLKRRNTTQPLALRKYRTFANSFGKSPFKAIWPFSWGF